MNARKTIADKEAINEVAKRKPEKKSGLMGFKPWPLACDTGVALY